MGGRFGCQHNHTSIVVVIPFPEAGLPVEVKRTSFTKREDDSFNEKNCVSVESTSTLKGTHDKIGGGWVGFE